MSYDEATKLRESFRDLVDGLRHRIDDVLALEPNGFVRTTTTTGVWRDGGGPFERTVCTLSIFGPDGRVTRHETFEPDRAAEALARFDALTAAPAPETPLRRRVRPNAATRTFAAIEAAFARRDLDAVDALLGDPLETIEHPTATRYGREGQLESSRRMMRMPDLDFRIEPLATLGDALCLARRIVSASGTAGGRFDVGEYEIESVVLNEVDAAGRLTSSEVFASDHLCQAIARLYARYAESLPDGPERTRAAGIASSHSVWEGPLDTDRVVGTVAPTYVCVDHRSLGTWSSEGRDEWLHHWRGQAKLAAGFSRRDDDILAFAPDATVTRHTYFATNRASGGPFENVFLAVNVFDVDGRYARVELYEPDQEAEALARYDALIGGADHVPASAASGPPFANAATRLNERFMRMWEARDWDGIAALHSPSHHLDDRRPLMRLRVPAADSLAQLRMMFEVSHSRIVITPIATRGERLSLQRLLFGGDVDAAGGALAIDMLSLSELGDDGRVVELLLFDPSELDAAYAELDARFAAAEGAPHMAFAHAYRRAFAGRDWDAIAALYPPTFVEHDHRAIGVLGATRGAEAWMQDRALVELAPDTAVRLDHIRVSSRGRLFQVTWMGSRDGAPYEIPFVVVTEVDEQGTQQRNDLYDPEQIDQARARFAELVAPAPSVERFANVATRALDRSNAAVGARDWEGFAALVAVGFRVHDRTRVGRFESGAAEWLAAIRPMVETTSGPPTRDVLATRGERLALARIRWRGAAGDVGPSEVEWLQVIEVDERGDTLTLVSFDPNDVEAGYAELDARSRVCEETAHPRVAAYQDAFSRALASRDWATLTALHAPTLVAHDHRLVGWNVLRGPSAFVGALRAMVDLAPDARGRADHLRTSERGLIGEVVWIGTRDGGAFESPFLWVVELDAEGSAQRLDFYDPHHLDAALARFAEIHPDPRPNRHRVRPNAAGALVERFEAAFAAGNLDAVAALWTHDLELVDHPNGASYGRDGHLASIRRLQRARDPKLTFEALATLGDALCLTRRRIATQGTEGARFDVGPSEHEGFVLFEIEERGPCRRIECFAVGHLDDALVRLYARYAELLPDGPARVRAATAARTIATLLSAAATGDPDRIAPTLSPAVQFVDHRTLGLPSAHRADAMQRVIRSLFDLAADVTFQVDEILGLEADGFLWRVTLSGTDRATGGRFELPGLNVWSFDADGLIARLEIFDVGREAEALARFEALVGRAGPAPTSEAFLRPTPFENAATESTRRLSDLWSARDWSALLQALPPQFRYVDRRPMAHLELDRGGYVEFIRQLGDMGSVRFEGEMLATRGDRLALGRARVEVAGGDVGPSEVEFLDVVETDERGEPVARIRFDPDALDAAYAELDARYAAGEGARHAAFAASRRWDRAFAARDWDALAAVCAPDVVRTDHRPLGFGQSEDVGTEAGGAARVVQLMRSLVDLASDVRLQVDHLRTSDRGALAQIAWRGTRDGGAFEIAGIVVHEVDDYGRIRRFDIYALDRPDEALARFAAIGAPGLEEVATGPREGGPFEIPVVGVVELDAQRRQRRFDLYDVDKLDQAWARFAEIAASVPPNPLRIPANAATRAVESIWSYADAGDWDALRPLFAPVAYEDRRRLLRVAGDGEVLLANIRQTWAMNLRPVPSVPATFGERLALYHSVWRVTENERVLSEAEGLALWEVDDTGRVVAFVIFDSDDRRAALREAWARWAAIDPVVAPWVELLNESTDRWNDRSSPSSPRFADDVIVEDHRRTGFGRIEGADTYAATVVALWGPAPDQRLELGWFWPAVDRHHALVSVRREGTLPDGGTESNYLALFALAGGRIARLELFETDGLDRALARFEELRAARTT